MDKALPVSDIMTTNVISVHPEDTMEKVQDIFRKNEIHHLPVVSDGKVVGIISHSDYLKLLNTFTLFKTEKSERYNDAIMSSMLVKEVMTKQVAKLDMNDTIEIAAGFFRENLFHALPVVNGDGDLQGIVTTYDLLNYAFASD